MNYKKASLRAIGLFGSLLFIPLFIFTFLDPQAIEKTGRTFIEYQLEAEVSKKVDGISLPKASQLELALGNKAKELREQTEQKIEKLKLQLKNDAPEMIAQQLRALKDLDCECRTKWAARIRSIKLNQLLSLEVAKQKLTDFTQAKYMEIVSNLTADVRIFLGSNAILFLMILLISFTKPQAISHLLFPSILMVISTAICSYFYLFEQNWFYTIIYNDYTGFAFVGYLIFVFAFLCDIAFNRAKVTTQVINGFLNIIGSAASLVPC